MPQAMKRALVLVLVAVAASGCCTAFNTLCDCVSCLANGPRLPFAVEPAAAETVPAAPVVPVAHPSATAASMAF